MSTARGGLRLEELMPGQRVLGVQAEPVEIVSTSWLGGNFLEITYRDADGRTEQGLLERQDEPRLRLDTPEDLDGFHGDGRAWKLAAEAVRLRHSALMDPMVAVSHSTLQPLPHQIKAVYGEFLPRTPLRYLLADDPGAGKTIMCGLYVKELILRGDLERCLIVAPGGLVDQWADELWEKFGLQFRVLSRDLVNTTVGASVFEAHPLLIARMDMLARNEELQDQLERSEWDLVVVDEAHRMSARHGHDGLAMTRRYELGRQLAGLTRNFLLMTATPHSGDPSAFQAFLSLLDEDRFEASSGRTLSPVPGTDVMRRMLKEELLTMEGKPLFPERRAYTVSYQLSPMEARLYDEVSEYVRTEMRRASSLRNAGDGRRASNVGFALTVLQRRLASSPEAILRSLERRRARLQRLLVELEESQDREVSPAPELLRTTLPRDLELGWQDDDPGTEEEVEQTLVDAASAAQTRAELEYEIAVLRDLVELAAEVRRRDTDAKWTELRSILGDRQMTDSEGRPRKIIIFSEHRDTLRYLTARIRELLGREDAVVEIHGGLTREARKRVQRQFTEEPEVSVLVATDAAGEGLNLQCAHLMVNYDLPWNPNRIEQRFGRIHRIGQTEVCHLWNLVAEGTREGDVFLRLLSKMAEQSRAYQGKVFDVLGEAFSETPLRELLVEAIMKGDDPGVRARLNTVIDATISHGIPELVERRAMFRDVLHRVDVEDVRDKMDLGIRTRLQPHFVSSWFESSYKAIGGRVRRRAEGTYEVPVVPDSVTALARRSTSAVLANRYDYVTFDPSRADTHGNAGAQLIGPGHPLLDAVAQVTEDQARNALNRGVVLVDPNDPGGRLRLFAGVSHEIVDGHVPARTLSKRVAFIEIDDTGVGRTVGPRYLDYRPAAEVERMAVQQLIQASPFGQGGEQPVMHWTMNGLVPEHLAYVRSTHVTALERARREVGGRLRDEIEHWRARLHATGTANARKRKLSPEQISARITRLQQRLERREQDLHADGHIIPRPPRILGCAVIVPAGLLGPADAPRDDLLSRAVETVTECEVELGRTPERVGEVSRPALSSRTDEATSIWIDVRLHDPSQRLLTMTRSEVLYAKNLGPRYRLALVTIGEDGAADVRYVPEPFARVRADDFHQHAFELVAGSLWRAGRAPF
jgi:SNF2 family DNA or RNA helicase